MQKTDDKEPNQTLDEQLEQCLKRMREIVDNAHTNPKPVEQHESMYASRPAYSGTRASLLSGSPETVSKPRAKVSTRIKNAGQIAVKKAKQEVNQGASGQLKVAYSRLAQEEAGSSDCDSPARIVYWQFPERRVLSRNISTMTPLNLDTALMAEELSSTHVEPTIQETVLIAGEHEPYWLGQEAVEKSPSAERKSSKVRSRVELESGAAQIPELMTSPLSERSPKKFISGRQSSAHDGSSAVIGFFTARSLGIKSPSPNWGKSKKCSPRHLSGPEEADSPSLKAHSSTPVIQNELNKEEPFPKTQPVSGSEPIIFNQPDSSMKVRLQAILTEFRNLTSNEAQAIAQILKHSKALIPETLNPERGDISISTFMNNKLLEVLSLSTLEQMLALVSNSLKGIVGFKDKLLALTFEKGDDFELINLHRDIQSALEEAYQQDETFFAMLRTSYEIYKDKSDFFTKSFHGDENPSMMIKKLSDYLGSDSKCTEAYLAANPTLVRDLVEQGAEYLETLPDNPTPYETYCRLAALKDHLLKRVENYNSSLAMRAQSSIQCVF